MSKPLCIFHNDCDDGMAAAWVVWKALGGEVDLFAAAYDKPAPDVTGRHVIMVDFSYKRPVLEVMAASARSILILDHHKTAAENLEGYPEPPKAWRDHISELWYGDYMPVGAIFDMNRCGAGIAWDYFNRDRGLERPLFLDYIEDRDLWRKKLPECDQFTMGLRAVPRDLETWDKLISKGAAGIFDTISEGYTVSRYYNLRCEEFVARAYKASILKYTCMIVNAPRYVSSEVSGALAAMPGVDFGAVFFEEAPDRWEYSLRSRSDFDVSRVAKVFGGGGHKAAAGFTTGTFIHSLVL